MTVLILFLSHYLSDFVCQNGQMGENKYKSFAWLLKHVIVYATVLGILTFPLFASIDKFIFWIGVNFFLHLGTDAITSRLARHFLDKDHKHAFWNVIGIDQASHYITLFYTYQYFS